jgi:prepilin-type N-terminal cleavage/methylation domain-containing protein/prepilin-type processing-associated H-X9-DG protein
MFLCTKELRFAWATSRSIANGYGFVFTDIYQNNETGHHSFMLPEIFEQPHLKNAKLAISCEIVGGSRAFTLLELLAVVSIVLVLAAFLVPTIKSAKESANSTVAANNVRQLALAQLAYSNDNDKRITPCYSDDQIAWQHKLVPYLGLKDLTEMETFEMRTDPRSIFNVPDSKAASSREFGAVSIAMNYLLDVPGGFSLVSLSRPSKLMLLGECEEFNYDVFYPSDSGAHPAPGFRRQNKTKAWMAFCDGHVEMLDSNALAFKYYDPESHWWRWLD